MAPALLLLLLVVVGGGIAVNLYLRTWVREDSRREAHLRDPHTHTVAYAIPPGTDPAVVETALTLAGYTSGIDRVGDVECVRVECDEAQRDDVRRVLEAVPVTTHDGERLPAGHVVFEDER